MPRNYYPIESQSLEFAKEKKQKLNKNTRSLIYSYLGIQDFINKALRLSRAEANHKFNVSNREIYFDFYQNSIYYKTVDF